MAKYIPQEEAIEVHFLLPDKVNVSTDNEEHDETTSQETPRTRSTTRNDDPETCVAGTVDVYDDLTEIYEGSGDET